MRGQSLTAKKSLRKIQGLSLKFINPLAHSPFSLSHLNHVAWPLQVYFISISLRMQTCTLWTSLGRSISSLSHMSQRTSFAVLEPSSRRRHISRASRSSGPIVRRTDLPRSQNPAPQTNEERLHQKADFGNIRSLRELLL